MPCLSSNSLNYCNTPIAPTLPTTDALTRLVREWLLAARTQARQHGGTAEQVAAECPLALGSEAVAAWAMDGEEKEHGICKV